MTSEPARDGSPTISAVIPCFNESENVDAIAAAVSTQLESCGLDYEIIFIDNASSDATVPLIKRLCANDRRIKLIANNRNYGQMRSPTHGIFEATASGAIIGISADFQDPPEMISDFIAQWRAGCPIVLAVRASEKTSLLNKSIRAIGYGFFKRFGDYSVIPGATGFGLYDRRVVDCLRSWRDPEPFFRGMLVESGFEIRTLPYHRPQRAAGKSKNNFFTLLSFALSGLASSSRKMLRVPFYVAGLTMIVTMLALIMCIAEVIIGRPPWGPLVTAGVGGVLTLVFLFLGLIGEQVRLISEMVRNTPLVIEKERVNFI